MEVRWLAPQVVERIAKSHPGWSLASGACPACVQQALLVTLLERGHTAFEKGLQSLWPLDAETAFGALPTPLRLHADPRFKGRGIGIAFVDAGFFPHPDLVRPRNRIRAWADAGREEVLVREFSADDVPAWPGSGDLRPMQWHGLMTSVVAAGNGALSHGLYRGIASEADVVLVQVPNAETGHIGNSEIERALRWIAENAERHSIRVVSVSVAGDPVTPLAGNGVDAAVEALLSRGIAVIAAAGNAGERRLVPPATSPAAITVGGLDDKNTLSRDEIRLWHGNYGEGQMGVPKPEVVAPSIWVVAPVLPGTEVAIEARDLFSRRNSIDESMGGGGGDRVEPRIAELKLVTPHYQHVEGTSFAAPAVASLVAAMLSGNGALSPRAIRRLLLGAAIPVPGAPAERQGAGAVDAGLAIALAVREKHGDSADEPMSPAVAKDGVTFLLHDDEARHVAIVGSWDEWRSPGLEARLTRPGLFRAMRPPLPPGRYAYKFVLDGERWLADPANPMKSPNGVGGFDSVLVV
jgi:serine protease AprX